MWAQHSCQDENGHGVVHVHVRKDKDTFEFSYLRTLPGEKLNLVVSSAKKDKFKKKEAGHLVELCSVSKIRVLGWSIVGLIMVDQWFLIAQNA